MDRDMNATAKDLVLYALNNSYVEVRNSRKYEKYMFYADNPQNSDWSYTCQRSPITSNKTFRAYQCYVAAKYLCSAYYTECGFLL